MNKNIKALIGLFVALNIAGFGVAVFLQVGWGGDPITVLLNGIYISCNKWFGSFHTFTPGDGSRIYGVITLIIALILDRKKVGWTTVVFTLGLGFFIDFYSPIISPWNLADISNVLKAVVLVLSQIFLAIGYSILVLSETGMNQPEIIAYYLADKTGYPFKYIRTGIDIIFIGLGFLLGGTFGVGSIFAMLTTGFFMNAFMNLVKSKTKTETVKA